MIRYALCKYYEPFVIGGPVWQFKRYEIDADDVNLVNGFKGFIFKIGTSWSVHELNTGGFIGSGESIEEAIYSANCNIKDTVDLDDQIKSLGDVSKFPIVKTEEALQRLRG